MLRPVVALSLAVGWFSAAESVTADEGLPRVPEGFTVEKVAASPMVKHPVMAGFDDGGRLFVAETAGKNLRAPDLLKELPNFVRLLEDTDGDGRFDKSTIFADKMTFPMGAVWYRGALYVASPPSIWKLEDTDDDGIADKRTELVDKFGFTGNAASIHGCFLGPCGRIYWCDGRHGYDFSDGRTGKASGIFSCRHDGSDVEVFAAGGMDNPVEIDFLPTGEMLGTANIMLSNPRVDVLTHWIDGGAYPRHDQEHVTAELKKTGDLLPPTTRLGHVAVSGLTRYRSEEFGPEYRDNLFVTIFNTHRVIRSIVERDGATFRTRQEEFLVSDDPDFHPTDVLEDADGSVLVIDTGGWFRIGCPTSQVAKPDIHGAIYRIRRKGAHDVDDPRGLKLQLEDQPPRQLVQYLDDPRFAVRERVIDLLAKRGAKSIAPLQNALVSGNVTSRRNAVWSLSRMEVWRDSPNRAPHKTESRITVRSAANDVIRSALNDTDEGVRIAATRALGTVRDRQTETVEALTERLRGDTPTVRREVATALGRILTASGRREPADGNHSISGLTPTAGRTARGAIEAIVQAVPNASSDRYLEHALIYALIRIADRERTLPYLDDPNPQVRRAALIALDQMDGGNLTRELVVPLLDTDDPALQKEALRVIGSHEGWAGETLKLLRGWLDQKKLSADQATALRGFLLAQSRDRQIQELIAEALGRRGTPSSVRSLLLEIVYRSPVHDLPDIWLAALQRELVLGDSAARLQAVRIVQDRGLGQFDSLLRRLARDDGHPAELRVEALAAVAPRIQSLRDDEFAFLIERLGGDIAPLDRLAAARALGAAPLSDAQLIALCSRFGEAGPLAIPVLVRAFARSKNERVGAALLDALKETGGTANLSGDELAGIFSSYPPNVRRAASGLMRSEADSERERARLQAMLPLADGGDAARGRELFFGKRAACAGCHTIDGQGGRVGPDLSEIGRIRTGRDMLEAVALPSASFARGYRTYVVVTERGRVYTGILSRQAAGTVYLRTAELAEVRIRRDQIVEMRESTTSIMPKGLDDTLTEDELRDLVAFLRSRK